MPRKLNLETPSARLKLPIRKKPYRHRLDRGLSLAYRRNESAGVWSTLTADGAGGERLKRFGLADDFAPADGARVFSFTQAGDAARKLTRRGEITDPNHLLDVDGALVAYKTDLESRGASGYNAEWPRQYLPQALLNKPIPLIDANELRRWRDSLQTDHAPATVNRLIGAVVAALNLAAQHDPRITSREPWRVGLQALPDATRARNCILTDDQVRALVAAAYACNARLGLFVDVLAVTGARPSQVARLEVGDLRAADLAEAKLLMPRSGKGGGRLRIKRMHERISVPITPGLATRLKATAVGRGSAAPLLLWRDNHGWDPEPAARYRDDMRAIIASVGLGSDVTPYALRHSSIVRQLMVNVPIRLVASLHDTSTTEIERHYSKHISEGSDAISRRALLADVPLIGANVIPLVR